MTLERRAPLRNAVTAAVVLAAAIVAVVAVDRGSRPDPAADAGPPAPGPDQGLAVRTPSDAGRPAPDAAPPSPWIVHEGTLARNQTLTDMLQPYGVDAGQVQAIVTALDGIYDFREARPGAKYAVRMARADGRLVHFRFEHGPLDVFEVERGADGALVGRRVEVAVRTVEAEVGATIEQSLYHAMRQMGESAALVALIVDVFAWDIDFFKDQHPGDRFRVVVEKIYKDEEFIRYGRILAAEYAGKVGTFRVFWFQVDPDDEKSGGYFLEDGRSARKTFLATPLKYSRISSGYSKARKHPVLGYTRAHLGVDYAAPRGTPVWAMAEGKVVFAGYKGANGNLVVIEHANGLKSYYAHLHRIARGIKRGVRVDQKRVIGQVGSTGLSTGPHLHFAVKRNGHYVNPRKLKMTRSEPVPKSRLAAFKQVVARRTERLAAVAVLPPPAGPPAPPDPEPAREAAASKLAAEGE